MSNLTPAQKEAFARANTSTVNLWTLELRHPLWVNPIRVVQAKKDLSITLEGNAPVNGGQSVSFSALAFELKEPEISAQPDSVLDATADGVSGFIQPLLSAANRTSTPVEVAARQITYNVKTDTVGQILQTIHLQLRATSVTKTTVTMKFGYTNTANRAFPAQNYTPETNPGLL